MHYRILNNPQIFDMNISVKNLPTAEIELEEKLFGDIDPNASRKSMISIFQASASIVRLQKELSVPKKVVKDEAKEEHDYMYNKYTATAFSVIYKINK